MNKIINTFLVSLCLVATTALAEMPLTPQTAANMQKVMAGFSVLEQDMPEMSEEEEGASPLTPEGRKHIVEQIKASPQHGKALKLVKDHGFESLEAFFDFMGRVSSASLAFGLETNGVSEVDMDMSGYMENLKQQGLPPEMLAQIQNEMAATMAMTKSMNAAAKTANPADVAALKKYPEILKILEAQ